MNETKRMKKLYAEDVKNYWKTSGTSADTWLEKAKNLIISINGKIIGEAFGSDPATGYSAYMLAFEIEDQRFKIIWPVLSTRHNEIAAAKRQAATFIYRDVKARVMSAKVLGIKAAFFAYMQLPDGRTTSQATVEELSQGIPYLLKENV